MRRRRIGFSLGPPQLYAEAAEDNGKGNRRRPSVEAGPKTFGAATTRIRRRPARRGSELTTASGGELASCFREFRCHSTLTSPP
jgi:hypothetical protein